MEELIYWKNGMAIIEPVGEDPFEVHAGDYFIQAKGFQGKWNFIDIGGPHLELALIAKNRPDSTVQSPMTRAIILERDMLSSVTKPDDGLVYEGAELTMNLLTEPEQLERV